MSPAPVPPTDHWAAVAERLGTDLFLDLQPDPLTSKHGRGAGLRKALGIQLRAAITDGRLPAGTRLPPYRSLAADLGVARATVSSVYTELIAEGWLVAKQGSGTRVAHGPSLLTESALRRTQLPSPPHDFTLGVPTAALFPRTDWIAATRVAMTAAPNAAFGAPDPQGARVLREELARYLARVRGVRTTADNIILTTSVHTVMKTLSQFVFGETAAVEGLNLPIHRMAIEAAGTATVPLPVDADGAAIDALSVLADPVSAVVLTPSHQFPTGVALSPTRRAQVVEWALRTGSYVVEDDYDGELRYDREPVGALQALAPDRVIYTGSVSKTLSPAVRVAWIVLPDDLVDQVLEPKGIREPDASIVDQLTLAQMIASGAYDRHVRRSRQFYRKRRDLLVDRLNQAGVDVAGVSAGLHAVADCPVEIEDSVIARAWAAGCGVYGLSVFEHPRHIKTRGGIVIGFSAPSDSTFAADVEMLTRTISRIDDCAPRSHEARVESRRAETRASRRR